MIEYPERKKRKLKIFLIVLIIIVGSIAGFSIRYPIIFGLVTGNTRLMGTLKKTDIFLGRKIIPGALVFHRMEGFRQESYNRYYILIPQEDKNFNYLIIADPDQGEVGFPIDNHEDGFLILFGTMLLQSRRGDTLNRYYRLIDENVNFKFNISNEEISFLVPRGNIFSFEGKQVTIRFQD